MESKLPLDNSSHKVVTMQGPVAGCSLQKEPSWSKPLMITYIGGYYGPARFRQRRNPVDAKGYDFRAARTNLTTPNNLVDSVIHMMMCAIGFGLVVVHSAYMECGLWTSLGMNVLLACAISYCACILVWSAQKLYGRVQVPKLTYPDVAEATALLSPWPNFRKRARWFRYIVELTLILHLYGSCCVLVIMIGRNLKQLVEGADRLSDAGDPSLRTYILILMVPCALVCMVTDLKYLAPFALIAVLYAVAVIIVTIWYTWKNVKVSPLDRPAFKSVMGLFQFIGVCVFVLETASMLLPIENNMDKPENFHYVVLTAMPIVTAMMLIIGFFGYWHYGEGSVPPITIHFPISPFAVQLKVFLCLVLYVIYALCFYVAFDIEWLYLRSHHPTSNYWLWERLYRTLHVIAITLVAYALPNVTRLMGILGAFSTSPAVFLYPPFIELVLDWEYPGLGFLKWRLLKFLAIAMFGLTILCGGSYYNIVGLVIELREQKIYGRN